MKEVANIFFFLFIFVVIIYICIEIPIIGKIVLFVYGLMFFIIFLAFLKLLYDNEKFLKN